MAQWKALKVHSKPEHAFGGGPCPNFVYNECRSCEFHEIRGLQVESETFTPVLSEHLPAAGAIAAAHLHRAFGSVFLPWLLTGDLCTHKSQNMRLASAFMAFLEPRSMVLLPLPCLAGSSQAVWIAQVSAALHVHLDRMQAGSLQGECAAAEQPVRLHLRSRRMRTTQSGVIRSTLWGWFSW